MKKDSKQTVRLPKALREAFVTTRGGKAPVLSVREKNKIFPVSAEIEKKVSYASGDLVPKQGIYLGRWMPKNESGHSIGKEYHVFAAPSDLTNAFGKVGTFTHFEAVRRIKDLKRWHGFAGGDYINDIAVYEALESGTYHGEWFIPPIDLLAGLDGSGNYVQTKSLCDYKDTGAFKDSFNSWYYWSSTGSWRGPFLQLAAYVPVREVSERHAGSGLAYCRLVRAVEIVAQP